MKSILMAIMAVAVAVTFSAPSFAGDEKKEKKDEKKGGHVLVYGDEKEKTRRVQEGRQRREEGREEEGRKGQVNATEVVWLIRQAQVERFCRGLRSHDCRSLLLSTHCPLPTPMLPWSHIYSTRIIKA